MLCFLLSSDAKRLIGRKFDDPVVQSDMKYWPFKVVNDSSKPKVEVEYKGEIKTFYPEEVSSMILTKMKEISEAYLGKVDDNKDALLYSDQQRVVWFYEVGKDKLQISTKSTFCLYPLHLTDLRILASDFLLLCALFMFALWGHTHDIY